MTEAEIQTEVEAVCRAWWSDWPDVPNPNGARELARKAVEAVADEQARELRRTGVCSACGASHGSSEWIPTDILDWHWRPRM
jgi:hypothetical protein